MRKTGTTILAAGVGAALAVLLVGCSSGGASRSSAGSADTVARADTAAAGPGALPAHGSKSAASLPGADRAIVQTRKVISTGRVTLVSNDIARAREQIDRMLATFGGFVSGEQTTNDRHGRAQSSTLQLRVPAADFERAMGSFKRFAKVRSAHSETEDVTTQVIDVQARVLTERATLHKLRKFLLQTSNVDQMIQIESEISTREADLASLTSQQRYLDDQTQLSTIDVYLTTPPRHLRPAAKQHRQLGFLNGLRNGWTALDGVVVVTLTVLGAVLPFAVLVALLGVPAWLLVRRTLRRQSPAEPTPTEP
ncbi:MAG: DUF4349 domain-containing protein [Nocardioidaceae bacterium]